MDTRVVVLCNVRFFSNYLLLTSSIVLYWKPLPAAFCYFSCATAHFPHTGYNPIHSNQCLNLYEIGGNWRWKVLKFPSIEWRKKTRIVSVCANERAVNFCMRLNKLSEYLSVSESVEECFSIVNVARATTTNGNNSNAVKKRQIFCLIWNYSYSSCVC